MEKGLNTGKNQAEHEKVTIKETNLSRPTVEREIQTEIDAHSTSAGSSQRHDVIIENTLTNQPDTRTPAAHELYEINDNRHADSGLELQPSIGLVRINPLACRSNSQTLTTDDA